MRDWYGWICLVAGSVLVMTQVVTLAGGKRKGTAAAAQVVKDAAASVAIAAANVKTAHTKVLGAANTLRTATTTSAENSSFATGLGDLTAALNEPDKVASSVDDAKTEALAAKKKADNANDGVGEVLNSLAGKVPMATAGIVLLTLGSLIMGWLRLGSVGG